MNCASRSTTVNSAHTRMPWQDLLLWRAQYPGLRSNQHSASCHAVWHVIKFLLLVGTACAGNSGLSSFLGEHELEMAFCAHAMLQQRAVIGSADAGV